MVGREVWTVEHEADGGVESAYVRFGGGGVVAVGAEVGDLAGRPWPWYLPLVLPDQPLAEMVVPVEARERVEAALSHADSDRVERRMELRRAGSASVWLGATAAPLFEHR